MGGFGRSDETWDELVEAGRAFLIERAQLGVTTSYTELNTTLARRTNHPTFDFDRPDERAAMGHLLGLIVEHDHPQTGFMLSALVRYLNANDAGPGFYQLAQQLGLLPKGASANAKLDFWISQVKAAHAHYGRPAATAHP
ncbi:hypothetical protein [Streptacidiphilus monticola]|uniref:Uncharacterized protein n=1 Tax=Streptacidiphilus monticola TaxID=2161674 RepID=A0ABW1G9C7_9ACTN